MQKCYIVHPLTAAIAIVVLSFFVGYRTEGFFVINSILLFAYPLATSRVLYRSILSIHLILTSFYRSICSQSLFFLQEWKEDPQVPFLCNASSSTFIAYFPARENSFIKSLRFFVRAYASNKDTML